MMKEEAMELTSSVFAAGGPIPVRFTCEGEDVSPDFSWGDAPPATESLVLTLRDPDAPKAGGFTHWLIYGISPRTGRIEQNVPKQPIVEGIGLQGTNDSGEIGYMGPCPPSGMHRYFARLFALDLELKLRPGAFYEEVRSAMDGHILARAELMGTYAKKAERAA